MPGARTAPGLFLATKTLSHFPLKWSRLPASKRLVINQLWNSGIRERMPKHYADFYRQWEKGPQLPIHQRKIEERYRKDEFGRVVPVQQARIPILYPDEFHKGLWGGEGVIKGFKENPPSRHPSYKPAQETYFWPKLHLGVVYSEVLNKHLEVVMTKRAQRLIDQSFGLDNYLLQTPVNEIYSYLGLRIKREILLQLAKLSASGQNDELVSKYRDWIVTAEEADWHGLSFSEAAHKQLTIERLQNDEKHIVPLKDTFRAELVQLLRNGQLDAVDPAVMYDEEPIQRDGIVQSALKSLIGHRGK